MRERGTAPKTGLSAGGAFAAPRAVQWPKGGGGKADGTKKKDTPHSVSFFLAEISGIEPLTACVPFKRSVHTGVRRPLKSGGGERV